ncbi:MAG: DUF3375 domain-containing protein [Bacteroidota bacterium]|jgi:hypothetical protein
MNYEKALTLYRNDKTLQLLRAEHFPLLVSFFHLVFKQQDKNVYPQPQLASLLGDFIHRLQQQGIADYDKSPDEYLLKWAQQGYLRRYYESADEPVIELSPATENALKWLEDLNKQQFVGTHSRLVQFFNLLKQIVNQTAGPEERLAQLEKERKKIEAEMQQIRKGNFVRVATTELKENYLLAEETAKRLLADFRQVEENFRELDTQTRQTIIKSDMGKADLLDQVFAQQDHLWNTDQGKSFRSFWEFLMSENMQQELETLLDKLNAIPEIQDVKHEQVVDRIKSNLVEAGDKVNRSNDGLIEQLRKFVEQKNLAESKHVMRSIEAIESLLLEYRNELDSAEMLMEIGGLFKPALVMERPIFSPPVKTTFGKLSIQSGTAQANTDALFDQVYVDVEVLRNNIQKLLQHKSQVSLEEVLQHYIPEKGVAEILGYMQIATASNKHYVSSDKTATLKINDATQTNTILLEAPQIIYNR